MPNLSNLPGRSLSLRAGRPMQECVVEKHMAEGHGSNAQVAEGLAACEAAVQYREPREASGHPCAATSAAPLPHPSCCTKLSGMRPSTTGASS
jgi:hypothetical protein